jgi:hypothetical protein
MEYTAQVNIVMKGSKGVSAQQLGPGMVQVITSGHPLAVLTINIVGPCPMDRR